MPHLGLGRRWRVRPADPAADAALAAELGVSPRVAGLLRNRGVDDAPRGAAFLASTLAEHLRSPMLFREMPVAARRLLDAARKRERIVIYGDYDADGITGTSQLLAFLGELGAPAEFYIPHRLRDGYGLRAATLEGMAARGIQLVVTVDCGAAAHAELAAARRVGLDIIVCDHHQAPEERPPALAVLNPVVADAGFPFAGLSAAGVVFYLLLGTRMLLRETGERGPDLRRYLDLASIGTVADLVPLQEENRVLVRHGVREIARGARAGIRALVELSGTSEIDSEAIAFRIAPRLNAGGRLADAGIAVRLLGATDDSTARRLALELDGHNRERRGIEEATFAEAVELVEAMPDRTRRRSFVLASEGWHPGVVGIVASRMVEKYHRPSILLAIEGQTARGSGRAIAAVHLVQSLRGCADLLLAYGGHRAAAGLTLDLAMLGAFTERFESIVTASTREEHFVSELTIDAELAVSDVNDALADEIEKLEPFGQGNTRPLFVARNVEVTASRIVAERHLKLSVRDLPGAPAMDAIGFGLGERRVLAGDRIDLVFNVSRSEWQGRERLQLIVRDVEKPR